MLNKGYDFYLDKCLLPITPSKLEICENGNVEVICLADGGEISIPKTPKLREIRFDCIIPQTKLPFAAGGGTVKPAEYYLSYLKGLMSEKRPFQFIVSRSPINGKMLFSTNIKVLLESMIITEDAEHGFDILSKIKLREYREHKVKVLRMSNSGSVDNIRQTRESSTVTQNPVVIGSDVIINGRLYGNSYGEAPGQTRTNYRGKVNFINLKGSHPYHVTTPSGGWLGWVTKESLTVIFT